MSRHPLAWAPLVLLLAWLGASRSAAGPSAKARRASSTNTRLWAAISGAVGQHVAGDLGGAVASLARARSLRPLPELDALVGIIALDGQRWAAAERQLQRAVTRKSIEPLVYYWAGRAALGRGKLATARRRFAEARALGGDLPPLVVADALTRRTSRASTTSSQPAQRSSCVGGATARQLAARHPNPLDPALYPRPVTGAIELAATLLKRFPHRRQLWRTLGHLHLRSGSPLLAGAYFARVVAADSRDGAALAGLARCYLSLGLAKRAKALAERALSATPGLAAARGVRGEVLRDKDPRGALPDLRAAADGAPRDGRVLVVLAQSCAEANDKRCAERFFRYAVVRSPQLAAAHFGLALIEQQASRLDHAERSLTTATALDPGLPRYREALAQLHQQRGNSRAARQRLREAAQLKPAYRRFRRAQKRNAELTHRIVAALDSCGCPLSAGRVKSPCSRMKSDGCSADRRRLPRVLQHYFSAHQGIVKCPPTPSPQTLRRLLLSDSSSLNQKGKVGKGQRYTLRARLSTVPLWRWLRAK